MNPASLKDRIEAAKASVPEDPNAVPKPANAYQISGLIIKGDKPNSSWVAAVVDVDGDGKLKIEFKPFHTEIEWKSKKEDVPRRIKTWFLPDGIFKARIVQKRDEEPIWHLFAVIDGQRENLTEQVAAALFINEGIVLPNEEDIPQ